MYSFYSFLILLTVTSEISDVPLSEKNEKRDIEEAYKASSDCGGFVPRRGSGGLGVGLLVPCETSKVTGFWGSHES